MKLSMRLTLDGLMRTLRALAHDRRDELERRKTARVGRERDR